MLQICPSSERINALGNQKNARQSSSSLICQIRIILVQRSSLRSSHPRGCKTPHSPSFCFLILGNIPTSKITLVTITAHNLICNLESHNQHDRNCQYISPPLHFLERKSKRRGKQGRVITHVVSLNAVCVAAHTVTKPITTIIYPLIRWYLYTLFALSTPPYKAGV